MNKYKVRVKTNSYAGNFEREMCAFLTGHIGECGVGSEFVSQEIEAQFNGKIEQRQDKHGCWRPVALGPNCNDFEIFFDTTPLKEDLDLLHERSKLFEIEHPYKYLTKDFKYLGLEVIEEQSNENIINRYEN